MTTSADNVRWYAIRTHLNQESRAECNLRAWNVELFCPKIEVKRRNEFSGVVTSLTKPFFPRYIFAKVKVEQLHKVCWTRGVHSVVSFGGMPTPVDDDIIEFLKTRVNSDGIVRGEKLKPGDKVIVKSGVLDSIVGIFEREMNDNDRVMVLLDAITWQPHVIVERSAIRKVAN